MPAPRGVSSQRIMYTIGHGTRTVEEILEILQKFQITKLIDVRSFPNSKTNPQFNEGTFASFLGSHGIAYKWMGDSLGGRRKKQPSTPLHTALRVPAFKNYAAYMTSPMWIKGIQELCAEEGRLVYMCSETLWWRCHRRMISDYLVLQGWKVHHLGIKKDQVVEHELWDIARPGEDGSLVYDQVEHR